MSFRLIQKSVTLNDLERRNIYIALMLHYLTEFMYRRKAIIRFTSVLKSTSMTSMTSMTIY